ncbi:uncharacterized protein N7483_007286 [Penicillium malachiteum]|uniref:uncharacterized protein n=1 Tax=Penicillium malachiteum TaxID=1324776 RepID=UPI0025483183|nr:uncharacterized protein N7483_007286 [Penicillium malachiteum]KAJ5725929.1 hypothetical protein N7483_007286 [Penicillium malachiteum]
MATRQLFKAHPPPKQIISTSNLTSPPRTLLLTFDAFDTLFYPRPSVPEQYASVAHKFGLSRTAVTPKKLTTAFKDNFRTQITQYPNYGRADVLRGRYGGPRQWWEELIRNTFAQTLSTSKTSSKRQPKLPKRLVENLIDRFAGAKGYALYEDVAPFFAGMRELKAMRLRRFDRVVVGVISNSDDRVPAVLKDLGLRVGDQRADQDFLSMMLPGFEQRDYADLDYDAAMGRYNGLHPDNDVDMVITSYEAGAEKPNRLIFDVAERQARKLVRQSGVPKDDHNEPWTRVHIGDDYYKDYVAAHNAGWQSYLLLRANMREKPPGTLNSLMDIFWELRLE